MTVPTKEEASAQLSLGLERVSRSSGPIWQMLALGYLKEYVARHSAPFLAENVREWAEARGLGAPTNGKAWGPVMQNARRAGIICAAGYAPAKSSHLSPKVLWRAGEPWASDSPLADEQSLDYFNRYIAGDR